MIKMSYKENKFQKLDSMNSLYVTMWMIIENIRVVANQCEGVLPWVSKGCSGRD